MVHPPRQAPPRQAAHPIRILLECILVTSVCHSVHRGEGRVSLIPFPSGGCVGGYTLPPKGHGTRDPYNPWKGHGTRDTLPLGTKWAVRILLDCFLVSIVCNSTSRGLVKHPNPLIIRATNSYRFQELNIPNTFLRFNFACCALNLKFPNVIYSILVVVICLRRRLLLPISFRKNHGCTTLQLNNLSFPILKNGLETDAISSE